MEENSREVQVVNYTVTWTPHAEQELATVWVAATDRNAVTAATYQLDQEIAADPHGRGLSRGSSAVYTAVELPLGIEYSNRGR
ncbi:MAG TPA: hypothetical protein VGE74_28140 [Gemmata sp.]